VKEAAFFVIMMELVSVRVFVGLGLALGIADWEDV